jgi:cellulose 1,4-beta-cellobiosidase
VSTDTAELPVTGPVRRTRRQVLAGCVASATGALGAAAAAVFLAQAFLPAGQAPPAVPARATAAAVITMCQPLEKLATHANAADYIVFNETMGHATQCLSTNGRASFQVTSIHSHHSAGVHAYPDIYYGCARRVCSPGTILPMRVSKLPALKTTWRYSRGNKGVWNAAYDLWFSRRGNTSGHPSGPELMIWLGTEGRVEYNPAGHGWHQVQIDGTRWWLLTWRTYDPSYGYWTYIQFRRVHPVTHATLALRPFLRAAQHAQLLAATDYLRSIDAGFEIWSGGRYLRTNFFSVKAP